METFLLQQKVPINLPRLRAAQTAPFPNVLVNNAADILLNPLGETLELCHVWTASLRPRGSQASAEISCGC